MAERADLPSYAAKHPDTASSGTSQQQSVGGSAACPLGYGASRSGSAGGGCPLGFGQSPLEEPEVVLPAMPLSVLQKHGAHGLVSIKGIILDVRDALDVPGQGEILKQLIGHDASRLLASHTLKDLDASARQLLDQGCSGLSYDQLVRLEKALEVFSKAYKRVGRLSDGDMNRLWATDAPTPTSVTEADAAGIHACIEAQDLEALRHMLSSREDKSSLANAACLRTGLTPLHKAVEAGHQSIVKELIAAGADREAQAELYGGDTPLRLALRLNVADDVMRHLA